MLRWDDITQATRAIVARDGAGAVTVIRLADELAVDVEAIRIVAVDVAGFVRSAVDSDIGAIAEQMRQPGDWLDLLANGLADSILVGRRYMTGVSAFAAGFALGPGVISWIDAVISLLEQSQPADDEWLYRSYRLVTAIAIGSAYTFRSPDGRAINRDDVVEGVRKLLIGLPRPEAALR
jgi:hypothetical protein